MAAARIAINGFGRTGRLALRAGWAAPELEFVHVNEVEGDAATGAHLLTFDSVHGRWPHDAAGQSDALTIDGTSIGVNDDRYDPARHDVLTAASCTTNCLAPVVKVIHEGLGIDRGSITTLHDLTTTRTTPGRGSSTRSRRWSPTEPR